MGRVDSAGKIPVPSLVISLPQLNIQIDPELIRAKLHVAYSEYHLLRFPYAAPIPAIQIQFIDLKSIQFGTIALDGYRIIAFVPQSLLTIHFEATKCLNLIRPYTPLLKYPKEALDHILTLLDLPQSGVEVTRVQDNLKLTWGKLKTSFDEIWTVPCYYIEFTHSGIFYSFFFDTKLRFFKNANNPDHVYLKHPLIREHAVHRCLKQASEHLKVSQDSLKITDVIPTTEGQDIGYLVTINNGLIQTFFSCTPDYSKDPWQSLFPQIQDSDLNTCLAHAANQLKVPQSTLKITKLIRAAYETKYTVQINNLTLYLSFKENSWKIIPPSEFFPP